MNEAAPLPKYSLKPGWICFVVAVLVTAIFGPLGLILGGPLMLVCVILSIVAMAKDNTGGGIALLLSSLFLIPSAFLVWMFVVAAFLTLSEAPDSEVDPSTTAPERVLEENGESTIPQEPVGEDSEASEDPAANSETEPDGAKAPEEGEGESSVEIEAPKVDETSDSGSPAP